MAAALCTTTTTASAAFTATGSGQAASKAATMPSGPTPTVRSAGLNGVLAVYEVSFTGLATGASTVPVTSYVVQRQVLGGWITPTGSCATAIPVVSPVPTAYVCSESLALTLGQPRYRVAAAYLSWTGAPGATG
ncbi:unannotated protein [freshwater metagenome]|uniref:Unannotated protein n=1 Tax=freshwater metagenome TaxID=449393 RepID=A0A6J7H799_9ZZZZ